MNNRFLENGLTAYPTVTVKTIVDGKAVAITDLLQNNSEQAFYLESISYYFLDSDGAPNFDGVFSVGKNNPAYDGEENSQSMGAGFQAWNTGGAPTGKVLPTETLKCNVTVADTSINSMRFELIVTGKYL